MEIGIERDNDAVFVTGMLQNGDVSSGGKADLAGVKGVNTKCT